jgi:hypothetical protein
MSLLYVSEVSAGISGGPALNLATKIVEVSTDTTCSFRIDTAGGGVSLTDTRLGVNERMIRRVIFAPDGSSPIAAQRYAIFTTANA